MGVCVCVCPRLCVYIILFKKQVNYNIRSTRLDAVIEIICNSNLDRVIHVKPRKINPPWCNVQLTVLLKACLAALISLNYN